MSNSLLSHCFDFLKAKERRVGENPDYSTVEGAPTATSGYKNVPPNVDP